MTTALTVYFRVGCSLCEALQTELAPHAARLGLSVRNVDIDSDPALARRYGDRVPVLVGEAGEICHYFFDPDALERYFSGT